MVRKKYIRIASLALSCYLLFALLLASFPSGYSCPYDDSTQLETSFEDFGCITLDADDIGTESATLRASITGTFLIGEEISYYFCYYTDENDLGTYNFTDPSYMQGSSSEMTIPERVYNLKSGELYYYEAHVTIIDTYYSLTGGQVCFLTKPLEPISANIINQTDSTISLSIEKATMGNGTNNSLYIRYGSNSYPGSICHDGFELYTNSETVEIDELKPSTLYYFFIWSNASDNGKFQHSNSYITISGTTSSDLILCGAPPYEYDAPSVVTNEASNVESTSATLNGYLEFDGNATTNCGFRYGKDSGKYCENITVEQIEEGSEFDYEISNLKSNYIYYYQAWANNSAGFSVGEELTLTTLTTKTDRPTGGNDNNGGSGDESDDEDLNDLDLINETIDNSTDNSTQLIENTDVSNDDTNTDFISAIGNLTDGKKSTVDVSNNKTFIKKVEVMPKIKINNVKISITNETEIKPSNVLKVPDIKDLEIEEENNNNVTIYRYVDIKLTSNETYVTEDGIYSMSFKFQVEKSWVKENNITVKSITMLRYHDDKWQKLDTEGVSDDATYYYFEAVTPGLSTFAVVGSNIVEKSEPHKESVQVPWIIIIMFIVVALVILSVVLVKKKYIYID